jgi:hypothetical protein
VRVMDPLVPLQNPAASTDIRRETARLFGTAPEGKADS